MAKSKTTKKKSTSSVSNSLLKRRSGVNIYVLAALIVTLAGAGVYLKFYSHAAVNAPVLFTSWINAGTSVEGVVSQVDSNNVISSVFKPTPGNYADAARYSPDYTRIAWTNHIDGDPVEKVSVYNVATKKVTASAALPSDVVPNGLPIVWYPDGKSFIVTGGPSGSSNVTKLYAVKADGSSVTVAADLGVLPSGGLTDMTSIAISGDGKYIGYSTAAGIFAVQAGSKPKTLYAVPTGGACGSVVNRPGTSEQFAYWCSSPYVNNKNTATINTQTVGAARKAIVSSANNSLGTSNYYGDMAWSPDGKKLALQMNTNVYKSACNVSTQYKIATVAASGKGGTKVLTSDPAVIGGCRGGDGGPGKTIAWNPMSTTIDYLAYPTNGAYALYSISSTGGPSNVKTLTPGTGNITGLSW